MTFESDLASLVSKEAAASRRDPERISAMIERLAAALGLTVAIASCGDGKMIETLMAGAEAYAMEEAVGRSKLLRLLRGGAAILLLAISATQAQAADLTIPAGTMICQSMAGPTSPTHAGCWRARGGQRVEIIAALSSVSQLRVWSSDGTEAVIVYAMRADADRIQRAVQ